MKFRLAFALVALFSVVAWADTLELKNGSIIKGTFVGGSESDIMFQVGSSQQQYKLVDIVSLKFDSDRSQAATPAESVVSDGPAAIEAQAPRASENMVSDQPAPVQNAGLKSSSPLTIPAGTRISIRTIDSIDSTKNHVGDRFQASLEEPLFIDGKEVVPKGTDVYGRLAQSKTSGTFTGSSQLRLELTGLMVSGQTVPLVTGEYELIGKSRGASTAKRTAGGAVVGTIIGAIAGGGKGAAIGAAAGGGLGAGSEIITKGDQVKIPSETLLDFTLQQEVTLPASATQAK
jgi:hypothetical protein